MNNTKNELTASGTLDFLKTSHSSAYIIPGLNLNKKQRSIPVSFEIVEEYVLSLDDSVTMQMLKSKSRYSNVIKSRRTAYYLMYNYVNGEPSLTSIGMRFFKDHATVINGLKKINQLCEVMPREQEKLNSIIRNFRVFILIKESQDPNFKYEQRKSDGYKLEAREKLTYYNNLHNETNF